jgi:FkbM family methyltransferase
MRAVTRLLSWGTRLLRRTPLTRSRLLNRVQLRLLGLVYRSDLVEVDGLRLRVHRPPDHIAKKLILGGAYEAEVGAALRSLAGEGALVMDVGANIGYHTITLSRAVGPAGRVVAVEPDPENLRLLRENLRLNGCGNVTVVPCALGASAGDARLSICAENRGFQGLVDVAGTNVAIDVAVRTAADLLGDLVPALVKIDVEGAEAEVLAGFASLPPRIVFEFSAPQLRAFGQEPGALVRRLVDSGYQLRRIDAQGTAPVEPGELAELAERSGLDYNLLATRGGG